ncbi:hypothetical protein [Acidisarcina polymorpha]|uniref:hypothetical protein n=1 Tax=Acidisarcina polymorpha TaxID=2211140 RepID=UPI001F3D522B|nr:hypothetical protein [Acidisarcina polymorpha]
MKPHRPVCPRRRLKLCRKHKATLVIATLDGLARNVAFISNLMESAVEFMAGRYAPGDSVRGVYLMV